MLTSSKFIYVYILTLPPVSTHLDLALFLPLHFPTCLSLCIQICLFFKFCNVFTADYFLACYFFVFIYYLQIVLSSSVPLWATFSTSLHKGHLPFSASLLLHLSVHIPNLIHSNSMLSLQLHRLYTFLSPTLVSYSHARLEISFPSVFVFLIDCLCILLCLVLIIWLTFLKS